MAANPLSADVVNNTDEHRYEVYDGSELAGFVADRTRGDRLIFTHTEIAPQFRHRGLASHLIKAALDDARRRHLTAIPVCPFVVEYIRLHPQSVDLVDEEHGDSVSN